MKSTFTTISGTKFESNDSYTYFYATFTNPVTKQITKKRISKHDFEQAQREDELEKAYVERKAIEEEAEKAVAEQDAQQELNDELRESAENFEAGLKCVEPAAEPKKTPKAKKTHKSKDVAYSGHSVTLTAKQTDFLRKLAETESWEGVDFPVWTDILCDEIGGQFAGKPMTVGAMISTLCEKDLGLRTTCRRENRKCVSFELTELGQLVVKELGLN